MRALTQQEQQVLTVLCWSNEPLTGRQAADLAAYSPTTTNRILQALASEGVATFTRRGRAALWTATPDARSALSASDDPVSRVAIVLTALSLEFTEMRRLLLNPLKERIGGVSVWRGDLVGDDTRWTIYLAQAGVGNPGAAAVVGALAGDRRANLVAFVGCAAGLKPDDHRAGDVIVADRLHNPSTGKQVSTESGSRMAGRDQSFNVTAPVLSHVRMVINDSVWTPDRSNPAHRPKGPHAYIGPIVASDSVQAAETSPLLDEVRSRYQNAFALDMESYGAAAGADFHGLPTLAVRGISDFIVSKDEPGNDDLQPVAARHAAEFLRLVLISAHPDDFTRAANGPQAPSPPDAPNGNEGDDVDISDLPGSVQMWLQRVAMRSAARAVEARTDLLDARARGGLATWANHRVHRPPRWLREDDTGDGWAMVATVAGLVDSAAAHRAYDRAAQVASGAGTPTKAAYLRLVAVVNRVITAGNKTSDPHSHASEAYRQELEQFPADELAQLGPLPAFYAATLSQDAAELKAQVEHLISALGLRDQTGVLAMNTTSVCTVDLDEHMRNLAGSVALRVLAERMLLPNAADTFTVATGLGTRAPRGNPVTRDLANDALKLSTWALALNPTSQAAQLTRAQALLGLLVALSGREVGQVEFEIYNRAATVEATAIAVRDTYRRWEIDSGPALAVAGRARSMQGDPAGALRLLRPPTKGSASPEEARHPDVVRIAAFLAMSAGDRDLALELLDLVDGKAEAALMRSRVLDASKGMHAEARTAYLGALEAAGEQRHALTVALLDITARLKIFEERDRERIMTAIDKVAAFDEDLARVLRARCAISDGDPESGLRLVRAMNAHELALTTRAQALLALGRVGESIDMVFEQGLERKDFSLITDALRVASRHRDEGRVRTIADRLLAAKPSQGLEMEALTALQVAERSASNWARVVEVTQRLVEQISAAGQPIPEHEYWIEAEAFYFLEKYEKATEVLLSAPSLTFDNRDHILLLFSILRRTFESRRPGDDDNVLNDLGGPAFELFMQAASTWAHDEQLSALALSTALTAKHARLSESQLIKVRELSDDYFRVHGEAATIRQIDVGDGNFDELFEILRANEKRAEKLAEVTRMVRIGRFPLVVLTAVAGSSYTESLIRRDLGYHLAIGEDSEVGYATAGEALNGAIVVDPSALVIGALTDITRRELVAEFDSVTVPFDLREDIARARASLALHPSGSMGWDARLQRPTMTEVPEELAKEWSETADELWDDIRNLKVGRLQATTDEPWMSAISLAKEMGVALWADDLALRVFARALGVPAFGTLDLVRATRSPADYDQAKEALRTNRVVDLPFEKSWRALAAIAHWDAGSPFFTAITRPAAWRDPAASFHEFQALIRFRPKDMSAEQVVAWTHAAATGLAQALPGPTVPTTVAALLAWIIFNTDSYFTDLRGEGTGSPDLAVKQPGAGEVTNGVLEISILLRDAHYPSGGGVEPVIALLGQVLQDAIGPAAAGQYMATLTSTLHEDVRRAAFAAYLEAVQD